MREYGGPLVVQELAEESLRDYGLLGDNAPLTLQIALMGFHFRSGAVALWLGSLAGSDSISARADLRACSDVVRSYPAAASSIQGGIFRPSGVSRLRHLVAGMTEELAEKIDEDPDRSVPTPIPCSESAGSSAPEAKPEEPRSIEERLRELQRLHDDRLISDDEYLRKREELLREL